MARYTDSSCKLCRRHGEKLFLKGTRCQTDRCAVARRPFPPGQHGNTKRRKKDSNYGLQMSEKQKVRRIYGVLEQQFRNYFKKASRSKGVTGEVLLELLERRLDNVIFRVAFALSRNDARQMVKHNLVCVNGRNVNIPSYQVKPGDVVELKKKDSVRKKAKASVEIIGDRAVPKWLKADTEAFKVDVLSPPERSEVGYAINENLIVELYSK